MNKVFYVLITFFLWSCQTEKAQDTNAVKSKSESKSANLDSLLVLYPDSLDIIYKRAQSAFEKNDWTKYLNVAAKAYVIDSSRLESRILYAKALLNFPKSSTVDIINSKRIYSKILAQDSSNVEALIGIAQHYGIDNIQECFRYTNLAIKSNPRYRDAYVLKGSIYRRLGDEKLMLSSWQTALNIDPQWTNGYIYIGSYYLSIKDPLSLEYFRSCYELEPNNPDFIYQLAYACEQFNKKDEALTFYRKIVSVDSTYYLGYFHLGYDKQFDQNDVDSAFYFYDEVLKINANHIESLHNKGLLYEEIGDKTNALLTYAKVLKIDPSYSLSKERVSKLK